MPPPQSPIKDRMNFKMFWQVAVWNSARQRRMGNNSGNLVRNSKKKENPDMKILELKTKAARANIIEIFSTATTIGQTVPLKMLRRTFSATAN